MRFVVPRETMNFTIPEGLSEMLRDFTVAVLRSRPSDLYQFAADYFSKTAMSNGRRNITADYSPSGSANGIQTKETTAGMSNSADQHHPQHLQSSQLEAGYVDGDAHGQGGQGASDGVGGAKVVPMYIVVDDDDEAREPDKTELRPKTSRQHRYGRRHSVSAERYDPEADEETDENKVTYAKNDSQRERLKDAVGGILIFRSLDIDQMSDVIDAMFERHVTPGETVIRQGDDGDNFYVIESGTYDVTVRSGPAHPDDSATTGSSATAAEGSGTNGDGVSRRVHTFDGKGSFGELALMYNMPRSATVIATSPGTLWAMDRRSFRRIVLRSAFRKRRMYEALIEKVPLLQHLDSYERMNVADALSSTTFEAGQCIIREAADADGMYFIEQGRVRVTITRDGVETEASIVESGGYFGEMALVENAPRSASVYADGGAVRVAFLERKCFERLLGPCLDIMRRNITTYKKSS